MEHKTFKGWRYKMKYDFDKVWDRVDTDSIKWDRQFKFGVPTGLIPFWIADTDFGTLPEAVTAIQKRLEHPLFGYTSTGKRTNETVRAWYQRRHHVDLPVEAFSPSEGVVTSIWFSIRGFTEPGDQVLVFTPVYDPFFVAIRTQERKEVDCPLIYQDGRYSINWEDFERKLAGGVKAMIFCNPHNPVGRVWTRDEVERVVMLCRKYSVWLFSDEIHGDVALYGNQYTSAACFADVYDRMIVYTAISKTFNMAGLHSSCSIIPNPEYKKRQEASLREAWLMSPNCLSNAAIEACYTYGDEWVDQQNAYLTENAEFIIHYLAVHAPEIKPVKPEGTYLMWLDCSALGMTSDEIQKTLADHYGIAVGGGTSYGGDGEHFLRFNFGCPRKTLEEGMEKLVQFVSDWRKGV